MSIDLRALDETINWFIPSVFLKERETRQRARMFVLSHMFGPILGNVIPLYLLFDDASHIDILLVLFISISSFWVYPFILRLWGCYESLALASLQNLLFAILWGCYFYGGVNSPFLPWLLTVPLLAFFYLGPSSRVICLVMMIVTVNCGAFASLYVVGHEFPTNVDLGHLQIIGVISTCSAAIYVSMMATFYARILRSQTDLEQEGRRHRETTELLRVASARSEKASAAKAEFLAKMSHELRTPLNAIIGYSQLILEEMDPQTEATDRTDVERIHSAGRNLLTLIDAILSLSKLEAGKMQVQLEPVDLEALVDDCTSEFRPVAESKGIQIEAHSQCRCPEITTDQGKVRFILSTLLRNAIEATSFGVVRIEIGAEVGAATISVEDSGPGIPVDRIRYVFEKFNSVGDQSSSKYDAAGLNLPLSYRLAQRIGGSLGVTSAPGEGATFTLRIRDLSSSTDPQLSHPALLTA